MKTKLFMAAGATLLIAVLAACSPKPASETTSTSAESIAPATDDTTSMSEMSGMDMSGMDMDSNHTAMSSN